MILAKLKESTRDQHEGLEKVVDVMSSAFTFEDYRLLLTKFHRFYSAVEPMLPAGLLSAEGFEIGARMKTPKLEADLEALGQLSAARCVAPWTGLPDLSTAARAFGSMYVMEGGTLGGQVITRHLRSNLGISPESGGAFFNSYGSDVGRMWKEFGAAVTAFAECHPETEAEIIEAARDTFDSFRLCFQEPLTVAAES